jgi:hypothetical protein
VKHALEEVQRLMVGVRVRVRVWVWFRFNANFDDYAKAYLFKSRV